MVAELSEKMYCVPCCAECEDKCFVKTQRFMCNSRVATRLEPHALVAHERDADKTSCAHHKRKITCAGTRHCVRVWCPVCTSPSRAKRVAIACKRNTVQKKIPLNSMMKMSTTELPANLRMENLLMDDRTTSNPFWGRHARNPLQFQ